jgi:glucokinase
VKLLAVDIGGTSIKFGISDEEGKIKLFREFDTESKKGGKLLVEKLIKVMAEYDGFEASA